MVTTVVSALTGKAESVNTHVRKHSWSFDLGVPTRLSVELRPATDLKEGACYFPPTEGAAFDWCDFRVWRAAQ